MRVSRIIINKSGPLNHLDIKLSPVTLIIGDNERGKTCLINWIARGVFEKPGSNSTEKNWSHHVGGSANVQIEALPFHSYFDAERMRNLLFIQETDLVFKYKNQENNTTPEYWNNEINTMLYGHDNISDQLHKSFTKAMGVGFTSKTSWMKQLHDKLLALKNLLEELLPNIEDCHSKVDGLFTLNNALGEIDHMEQQMSAEEEKFFILDKINLGKNYLDILSTQMQQNSKQVEMSRFQKQYLHVTEEIERKEDLLFSLDDKISGLQSEVQKFQHEAQNAKEDPYVDCDISIGDNIFNILIGSVMTFVGLFFAFQTIKVSEFTLMKLWAIIFFIIGIVLIVSTWLKSIYMQCLNDDEDDNDNEQISFLHQHVINKYRKKFLKKYDELEDVQKEYQLIQEEIRHLKRKSKNQKIQSDVVKEELHKCDHQFEDVGVIEEKVLKHYKTLDPKVISVEIKKQESIVNERELGFNFRDLHEIRAQRIELLDQRTNLSQDYEKNRNRVWNLIKPLLEGFKEIHNQESIAHFYPEVYQLEIRQDFTAFQDILEQTELLIDRVSRDRYRAEKLLDMHTHVESSNQSILVNTLHSSFFEYIVQNIFGGKYRGFRAEFDKGNKVRIFAETGSKEFFPLESLSSSTCSQFWFTLRLSLAKMMLGADGGIILLDDPFNTFDSIRKQVFIDLLNAFAHEGWQIVCTLTDDPVMKGNFQSVFGPSLQVIDLNYDRSK